MPTVHDLGWLTWPGSPLRHYWRERADLHTVITLCWVTFRKQYLHADVTLPKCAICEIMLDKENALSRAITKELV